MLLALLLILAGLAGAMAPQQAAAKEFVQIKIGGMTTTENFGTYYPVHIPGLKSGWIEYFTTIQHTKRALHLHDVVLEGDIEIEGADLTVVLYGKSRITGSIVGPKDIRITDGSSQNENSLDMGILKSEDGDIQIDGNCSVRCKKIRSEEGYVTIKNATVQAIGGAIAADDGIKLIGVSVLYGYPDGYKEIVEEKRDGDRSKMYYLVNGWGGLLHEVVIGPSGAPSQPTIGNGDEIFMTPSPDSKKEFPAIGGDIQQEFLVNILSLRYSASPQVIEKPDWIVAWRKGDRTFKTILSAVPNYGEARSGDVVFLINGFRKTYKFSQLGGADSLYVDVELTPREVSAEAGGMEFDATIRNKRGYVTCLTLYPFTPDAKDWLTITSGETLGYHEKFDFHIKVAPNTGPERKGTVIFVTTNGSEVLTIHQAANFTLEPKELDAGPMRDHYEVTLSCNVPYHINDFNMPDWLDVSGNSADYEAIQKMTIIVLPNTGGKREGVITFKTTAGEVKLKVTQEAAGTKPEAKFTLEPKELDAGPMRKDYEVTLSCNIPYHINDFNMPDWLGVSGTSPGLEAIQKITIFIQPNTGGKREGVITFKTTEGEVKLKVTQEGGGTKPEPEKPEPTLTLSTDMLTFPTGGGKQTVNVKSNYDWYTMSSAGSSSWMKLTLDLKTGTIVVEVTPNTSTKKRGATIEVSLFERRIDTLITRRILVTQDAANPKPALELEQENTISGSLGSPREVKIRSNVAWKATPTVAWLHVEPSEGTGSVPETLTITADPNESEKGRTGTITIESTDGSKLTRTLTVAQKPAEVAVSGLSINPAAMTMGSGGGMAGFNVYAGKGWTISGSPDWMHPDLTRGSGKQVIRVRFDRNESGAERTGKLTVKSDDGKAEKVFTLTQRAGQHKPSRPSDDGTYDYDLALNPEEITVGPSDGAGSTISVATSRLWAGSTTEDWIRLESAVGRGNGSFTFTVAPNPSKEMRHGTITVRTQQGMDELKVAIHQQGCVGDEEAPTRVKVSSVSLDPSSITVNGDIRSKLIGASVYPSNAANKGLLWMSSNPSVATVHVADTRAGLRSGSLRADEAEHTADDYAVVTIVGKGKATITAATSDGSSIVARCEVNVLSTVANTVPYAPQAKVYTVGPTLYLSLPTAETVQVYTLAGTLYRTWQAPAGDTSVTLPLGTYIIKVGHLTEKVVVR